MYIEDTFHVGMSPTHVQWMSFRVAFTFLAPQLSCGCHRWIAAPDVGHTQAEVQLLTWGYLLNSFVALVGQVVGNWLELIGVYL